MRSISVGELKALLDTGDAVELVDVREPYEYAEGHVPGARLAPLGTVPTLLGELPRDVPVYLLCAVGARSARAAAWLAEQGVDAVNVEGGTAEWAGAGYPLDR
jgi:rhodanese-related sulfurtransferase